MKVIKKLFTIIIGLGAGGLIYFALWSVFAYFGIVN